MTTEVWAPQIGPQAKAIAANGLVDELFFGGAMGGGKGLRPTDSVLTPWGFRPLSDLKVGSRICATDGSTQQIIGYFPRGRQPCYRLTWADGSETVCDADHIWLGHWAGRTQKRAGQRLAGHATDAKIYTRDLFALFHQRPRRFGIPVMAAPAAFNVHGENRGRYKHISRTVSPYIIGVLLGDGSLTGTGISFTSEDDEIAARVALELPEGCTLTERTTEGCPTYGLPGLRQYLADFDILGHRAESKFIPELYLHGTPEERWPLLQGLMDTDGWANADGDCYFTTVSPRLRDGVRYLARSLGALVTVQEKTPTYTHKGERRQGQLAYTLRIKIPQAERLFHLPRKAARAAVAQPQAMTLWLEDIQPTDPQETVCIAVSHPNSLFITDHFVVTHNTSWLLGDFLQDIDQGANWQGVIFRRHSTDMDEIIQQSMEIYPKVGAEYKVGLKEWRFPGGATLRLRHMDTDADFLKYMGWQMAWIGWDELPTWDTLGPYAKIKTRLRGRAYHKRIRATGNPGGKCHAEVKGYFGIDKFPAGEVALQDPASKMVRMFIPSKLSDNKILLEVDPDYPDRMQSLGDPELVRAWLEGDWDALVGSFFDVRRDRLMVDAQDIPKYWSLFASLDYGESNPTVGALLAVDYDDDVWVCGSYYATGGGAEHAQGIKDMINNNPYTGGRKPTLILAPGDMWTKRAPGEATQARSPKDTFQEHGLHLTLANMDRVNGWRNMGLLFEDDRLHFLPGTEPLVDSILGCQRSTRNPEDVEKGGDDHGADCFIGETLVDTQDGPQSLVDLVGTEGYIYSYDGQLHPYTHVERYGQGVSTVRVVLSDGRTVQCTPDHRFLSAEGEWIVAADLEGVSLWVTPGFSPLPAKNTTAPAITSADTTSSAMASDYIDLSGRTRTELYPKINNSITATETAITIPWTTWNFLPRRNTRPFMWSAATFRPRHRPTTRHWQRLPSGTARPRDEIGTVATLSGNGTSGEQRRQSAIAPFARPPFRSIPAPEIGPSGAAANASNVRVLRVEEASKSDVYCLTVPSLSAFTIEGGIAVHNCVRLGINHVFKPRKRARKPAMTMGTAQQVLQDISRASNQGKGRYGTG